MQVILIISVDLPEYLQSQYLKDPDKYTLFAIGFFLLWLSLWIPANRRATYRKSDTGEKIIYGPRIIPIVVLFGICFPYLAALQRPWIAGVLKSAGLGLDRQQGP